MKTANQIITRYRLFTARYLGPTNRTGSRVKITDTRFLVSKTIPLDNGIGDSLDNAVAYLESRGISADALGLSDNTETILSLNFRTSLK